MMYHHQTPVLLRHTDAAGVIYFAEMLSLCHSAYEAMLDDSGLSMAELFGDAPLGMPIVHAEVDLTKPVRVRDRLDVRITCLRLGNTSFTLGYEVTRKSQEVARAQTVHVAIDGDGVKCPLPSRWRQMLGG